MLLSKTIELVWVNEVYPVDGNIILMIIRPIHTIRVRPEYTFSMYYRVSNKHASYMKSKILIEFILYLHRIMQRIPIELA